MICTILASKTRYLEIPCGLSMKRSILQLMLYNEVVNRRQHILRFEYFSCFISVSNLLRFSLFQDYGYPQTTSTEKLKSFIFNDVHLIEETENLSSQATGPNIVSHLADFLTLRVLSFDFKQSLVQLCIVLVLCCVASLLCFHYCCKCLKLNLCLANHLPAITAHKSTRLALERQYSFFQHLASSTTVT